jgi:hypothetical protein
VSHDHMQVEEEEITAFVSKLWAIRLGYAGRLRCGSIIAITFVDFPNPVDAAFQQRISSVKARPAPVWTPLSLPGRRSAWPSCSREMKRRELPTLVVGFGFYLVA